MLQLMVDGKEKDVIIHDFSWWAITALPNPSPGLPTVVRI